MNISEFTKCPSCHGAKKFKNTGHKCEVCYGNGFFYLGKPLIKGTQKEIKKIKEEKQKSF